MHLLGLFRLFLANQGYRLRCNTNKPTLIYCYYKKDSIPVFVGFIKLKWHWFCFNFTFYEFIHQSFRFHHLRWKINFQTHKNNVPIRGRRTKAKPGQRRSPDEGGRDPSRYLWSHFVMKIVPSTFSISSLVSRFLTSTCFASLKTFAWNWKSGIDQTWVYHNRYYEIWTWKLHICNLRLIILIPLIHLSNDKRLDPAWKIVKTGLPTFEYIVELNSEDFSEVKNDVFSSFFKYSLIFWFWSRFSIMTFESKPTQSRAGHP